MSCIRGRVPSVGELGAEGVFRLPSESNHHMRRHAVNPTEAAGLVHTITPIHCSNVIVIRTVVASTYTERCPIPDSMSAISHCFIRIMRTIIKKHANRTGPRVTADELFNSRAPPQLDDFFQKTHPSMRTLNRGTSTAQLYSIQSDSGRDDSLLHGQESTGDPTMNATFASIPASIGVGSQSTDIDGANSGGGLASLFRRRAKQIGKAAMLSSSIEPQAPSDAWKTLRHARSTGSLVVGGVLLDAESREMYGARVGEQRKAMQAARERVEGRHTFSGAQTMLHSLTDGRDEQKKLKRLQSAQRLPNPRYMGKTTTLSMRRKSTETTAAAAAALAALALRDRSKTSSKKPTTTTQQSTAE